MARRAQGRKTRPGGEKPGRGLWQLVRHNTSEYSATFYLEKKRLLKGRRRPVGVAEGLFGPVVRCPRWRLAQIAGLQGVGARGSRRTAIPRGWCE